MFEPSTSSSSPTDGSAVADELDNELLPNLKRTKRGNAFLFSYKNDYYKRENEVIKEKFMGFQQLTVPITEIAINIPSGRILVAFKNGLLRLYNLLTLLLLSEVNIPLTIHEHMTAIKSVGARFYSFFDRKAVILSTNNLDNHRIYECQSRIVGVIQYKLDDFFVDCKGYIYKVPQLLMTDFFNDNSYALHKRKSALGALTKIVTIDACTISVNKKGIDAAYVEYKNRFGIIVFQNSMRGATVLVEGLMADNTDALYSTQIFDDKIYYNVLLDTQIKNSQIFVKSLQELNKESEHTFTTTSGFIKHFIVQNSRLTCITFSEHIEIFSTVAQCKIMHIMPTYCITALHFINHFLILGTDNGHLILKSMNDYTKMCRLCENTYDKLGEENQNGERVVKVCVHYFPIMG